MAESAGKNATLSTFLKWDVEKNGIKPKIKKEQGKEIVHEVYCQVCAKYSAKIKGDFRIKGTALNEVDRYASGSNYVTKHNINRHLSGLAHRLGLEFKELLEGKEECEASTVASCFNRSGPNAIVQPKIDDTMHANATEAYRKCLNTAYLIAVGGLPLCHFETVIKCQKANGVKLIHGYTSGKVVREFVHEIAETIREKLALIMCTVNSFGILTDGSQARKTSMEKELVLIRVVRSGIPVYYCVSLADMDVWGNANADNLKLAIDDVFNTELNIPNDVYTKKMVCATSDGASVNTGQYNGLLVQLKRSERPWLISMHCVSHRLELALKDSLLKEKYFSMAKDLMISIFYLFKKSGKIKMQFFKLAKVKGITVYNFPKVHGTRFINHQKRGLEVLLHNWGVLIEFFENCIESSECSYRTIKPKLKGILKKLASFRFLCHCSFYLHLLKNISEFSLAMEKGDVNIFEIPSLLSTTTLANTDILACAADYKNSLEENSIYVSPSDDGNIDNLTWKLPKIGHNRKHSRNREYVDIVVNRKSFTDVHNDETCSDFQKTLASKVIDDVNKCMNQRFQSEIENEFFQSMLWLDPANWNDDTEHELHMMNVVAAHFSVTLESAGFQKQNMKKEWPKVKNFHNFFYKGFKAKRFWEQVLVYQRKSVPNVCLLVELILCIGVSNSMVEKSFSQLTAMLSDRRLPLRADTMNDLLLIKVNHTVWSPRERDEIIEGALNKHMQKRRKLKLDQVPFNMLGVNEDCSGLVVDDSQTDSDLEAGDETVETESQVISSVDHDAHSDGDSSISSSDDEFFDPDEIEKAFEHIVQDSSDCAE